MPQKASPLRTYDSHHRVSPGERYNYLTTVAFSHEKHRNRYWTCLCDCGNETVVREVSLKAGRTGSCGCHAKALRESFEDLTGKVYGRLTVVRLSSEKPPVPVRSKEGKRIGLRRYWDCECECGNTKIANGNSLKTGSTKSCGCLARDTGVLLAERFSTTHGKSHTRLYKLHSGILSRCADKENKDYGGRGIAVAEDLKKYEDFEAWFIAKFKMAEPPKGMSLDRIDNNLGYTKDNLRLATAEEQVLNRRWAIMVDTEDGPKYLIEVCNSRGLSYDTVWTRYRKLGWSLAEALELAPRPVKNSLWPSSEVPGIYYNAQRGQWAAHANYCGRNCHVGHYSTEDEAIAAQQKALERVKALTPEEIGRLKKSEFSSLVRGRN
jgi:hypothetical protein